MQPGGPTSPEDNLNQVEELLKKAQRPGAQGEPWREEDNLSLYFRSVSEPEGRTLLMTKC